MAAPVTRINITGTRVTPSGADRIGGIFPRSELPEQDALRQQCAESPAGALNLAEQVSPVIHA